MFPARASGMLTDSSPLPPPALAGQAAVLSAAPPPGPGARQRVGGGRLHALGARPACLAAAARAAALPPARGDLSSLQITLENSH